MSLLDQIISMLNTLGIPHEVGRFSDNPPDVFICIVPLVDDFAISGDDAPLHEAHHVRLSLHCTVDYGPTAKRVVAAALDAGMAISGRHYVEFDKETATHHYAIDVAKLINMEV